MYSPPSFAAVTGQPLSSAPVARLLAAVARQSSSFVGEARQSPSLAVVAGQLTIVAGQPLSLESPFSAGVVCQPISLALSLAIVAVAGQLTVVAGQPLSLESPPTAALACQPISLALQSAVVALAGQLAVVAGQPPSLESPSLAAVAGHPLFLAPVARQSLSLAAVSEHPLSLVPVAGQSSSLAVVAGHPVSLTPFLSPWPSRNTKHKSPPHDCWWSEVLDMEIKGYVDLSDKSWNTDLCLLC
jgi:hypothetical protein